jgi:urease accessory protein
MIFTQDISLLRLLQLADSALPVGSSAHSFGLETLVDQGAVDPHNLENFLRETLEESGAMDAAFVRLAWNGQDLFWLNQDYGARRPARESRDASLKMGRRFIQLVNGIVESPVLDAGLHYCIAFGAAGAALGIPADATAIAYLQQSVAGLVSAAQRLMPLGQAAAARILWTLKPAIAKAAQNREVWCFSPFPELASMRHGSLTTRLFIS